MSNTREVDVIVVGAGMVGAMFACSLGNTGMSVALIDARAPDMEWESEGYDIRVSAITRATQNVLESLGVWPLIAAQRVSPYRDMHVWDATGKGSIHFDSAEIGEAELGHIIENRVIVKALHQRLADFDNIECYLSVKGRQLSFIADHVELRLDNDLTLKAKLIVAADGARSWVRQQADIAVKGWDYDQAALVTWVKTEQYHQDTAWQRFLPTGPLAFLPLTEGISSIVWSTSPEQANTLRAMPEARFAEALADAFAHTLGRIETVGPRAVFPLRTFETLHYVQPRLALVGDAAHTIHPLAGQGVNLGISDAASLSQVVLEAWREQKDIGDYAVLRRYERWRRAENRGMLLAMDGFKRLFSTEQPLLSWIRNTGLAATDKLTPLKNLLVKQAMGILKGAGK